MEQLILILLIIVIVDRTPTRVHTHDDQRLRGYNRSTKPVYLGKFDIRSAVNNGTSIDNLRLVLTNTW